MNAGPALMKGRGPQALEVAHCLDCDLPAGIELDRLDDEVQLIGKKAARANAQAVADRWLLGATQFVRLEVDAFPPQRQQLAMGEDVIDVVNLGVGKLPAF